VLNNRTKEKFYILFLDSERKSRTIQLLLRFGQRVNSRDYELMTEANAKLSVVGNCSRSSLLVCLGEGTQLAGGGVVSSSRGGIHRGKVWDQ
jgi:hypothetical protein